jgi:hypothetical protein
VCVISGDISSGTVNYEYIPPFAFLFVPGQGLVNDPTFRHRMAVLVYRQSGQVALPVEGDFCSPAVTQRLQNMADIASANGLGAPLAGNFFNLLYTPGTSDK